MNYTSVKSPAWGKDNLSITLIVDFEGIGEVPFTAMPTDPEPHGQELYVRAVNGDFGPVLPYAAPVYSKPETLALRLDALAEKRWQVETGGIVIAGLEVKTDRESQATLGNALLSLQSELIPSTEWKGANGWATVTLAEIEPIAQAVAMHVKACFSRERVLSEALEALAADPESTAADIEAFDISTGWPS